MNHIWRVRTLCSIVLLPINSLFHRRPPEIGIYTFRLLSYSSTSFFEALSSAWSDNYNGDKHLLLFSNIQRIRRSGKPYSNQIAIVQSSGTGKSRMVHEQAKLVFTIPFNLRESKDSQGTLPLHCRADNFSDRELDLAFPLADDAVRDYFVTFSVRNSLMLKTMYLKFLGSVFSTVEAELRACRTELENKQIRSGQELAKWWSDHLIDVRQELYEQAIRVTDEKTPVRIYRGGSVRRYSFLVF